MASSNCKADPSLPSNKHPRHTQSPNHQRQPAHRTPGYRRTLLSFSPIYDHLSIQAVHRLLRFSCRTRITNSRTRIRILMNPHSIRTTRLQNSLHISVWTFGLVQWDLIVILNVGGHGGGHRVARVVALGRLCEISVHHSSRCHGVSFSIFCVCQVTRFNYLKRRENIKFYI